MRNKNRVFFYINPDTHLLDLAGAVQVFFEASDYGIDYDIHYLSDKNIQESSAGLKFAELENYSDFEVEQSDIILVAGFSLKSLHKIDRKVYDWLNDANSLGTTIGSICTGSFMLAESGLLNGKECTTHWKFTE